MGLTVNAALVACFLSLPTATNLLFTWLVFVTFWSVVGLVKDRRPVVWAACAGAAWPTLVVLFDAALIVLKNQKFQGQLYDEDGPEMFVIKTIVLVSVLALPGFFVGLVPGVIVSALRETWLLLQGQFQNDQRGFANHEN